jgi:Flp pilus assembly protein TadB
MMVMVAGAVAGLGLLLLVLVLAPARVRAGGALARLDVARSAQRAERTALSLDPHRAEAAPWLRGLGRQTAEMLGGWVELGRLRSDLSLLSRSLDTFLATTVLAALAGLLTPLLVAVVLMANGTRVGAAVPVVVALVSSALAAVLPLMSVRSHAAQRRRDFRHVVGSFLDLVAMSLAGGRGVPEALQGASELSDGWAMVRIRNALIGARLRGETPWSALGALGEEVRIDELRDLAAALALVAEDGAKVRDSLGARAGSMRRRELAESEGKAGEDSQSMLVAQLLLSVGFLIFLIYPAMVTVLSGR